MTRNRILPTALAGAAALVWLLAGAAPAAAQHEGHGGHGSDHTMAGDEHAAHRAMMAAGDADKVVVIEGGLTIPDVTVRTQDGETKSFYSDLVQGRTVAMNFVFTTCTTICPPMGANFGRLQDELGERLGKDVFLISVSVDPTTDTPQRLKAWGDKFGARQGWTLVTGDQQEVERLLKSLQVFNADIADHAPVVLIGNDSKGEWTRAWGLAGPEKLAGIVARVGSDQAAAAGSQHEGHGHQGHGHQGHGR
jgi:protein SCO1/2